MQDISAAGLLEPLLDSKTVSILAMIDRVLLLKYSMGTLHVGPKLKLSGKSCISDHVVILL